MLDIRAIFDAEHVSFGAISFVLEQPRGEDGYRADAPVIRIENIRYEDIVKEGLVERLEQAIVEQEAREELENAEKMKEEASYGT